MRVELNGLVCPIDGAPLALAAEMTHDRLCTETLAKHTATGKHIHVEPLEAAACANGHEWRITGFMLERTQ